MPLLAECTLTSRPRDRRLLHPDKIHSGLTERITTYEKQTEIERNDIVAFHVRFEGISPFEDGNGRVGRLILFYGAFLQLHAPDS